MTRASSLTFTPCDRFPDEPEAGTFYYSEDFRSSLHLCACGCGSRVVLPIKPAGWSLDQAGDDFSLSPSVGNREFACRSHYLIKRGDIVWLPAMSDREVAVSRARDAEHIRQVHYQPIWRRFVGWLGGIFKRKI